jgi:hypothetical protein
LTALLTHLACSRHARRVARFALHSRAPDTDFRQNHEPPESTRKLPSGVQLIAGFGAVRHFRPTNRAAFAACCRGSHAAFRQLSLTWSAVMIYTVSQRSLATFPLDAPLHCSRIPRMAGLSHVWRRLKPAVVVIHDSFKDLRLAHAFFADCRYHTDRNDSTTQRIIIIFPVFCLLTTTDQNPPDLAIAAGRAPTITSGADSCLYTSADRECI